MTVLFIILLIAGIIGAVFCKKKKLYIPMAGCIIVAAAALFLLGCTALLAWNRATH